ncbi:hypothetical protein K438DRAFT_1796286 [Mycena galopus ATCC 62051]|nr:hypothetical protein K438DRAFT_1796286 [Mycena galopus ATCC 62051]
MRSGLRCGRVREGSRMKRKGLRNVSATTQVRCFQGYSTARGAGDPRSVAIYRSLPVTLPLGRLEVHLHSGIETHIPLPRNRCLSQPRTPHSARVWPALRETRGRIDPSSIVSSIFGLGLGLRWGSTAPTFARRLGGKDGSNTSSLDTQSSYSHSTRILHGPAVRSLALPHRLFRPRPLIHPDHDSDHMKSATSPTDFGDVPAIDSPTLGGMGARGSSFMGRRSSKSSYPLPL